MKLGTKIRKARERAGCTQQTLADHVGVSRLHITKLEQNKELPSIYCLEVIAIFLRMSDILKALNEILY